MAAVAAFHDGTSLVLHKIHACCCLSPNVDTVVPVVKSLDFYHVIDLSELITLLKLSDGKPHRFDYNLMQRFKCVREIRTIHVRSKAVA
ncbi:MAG: hypothetical protein CDV28_1024 [Candidatus Electronema aureum]|uniref:Uncharacterized protein n=1 Tax=Candidatus Electronema aureum TaxID=2005002 RepID=A0A521G4D5_9BACT|nr:MAG: hypothetical protein CDV28_1024 [Candidatus Electronema aureum]